jgi:hypothetical protein
VTRVGKLLLGAFLLGQQDQGEGGGAALEGGAFSVSWIALRRRIAMRVSSSGRILQELDVVDQEHVHVAVPARAGSRPALVNSSELTYRTFRPLFDPITNVS